MNDPLLTITVPAYNMEPYLDRCLRSVCRTHLSGAVEILVVNDGSTDGSLALARNYEAEFPAMVRVIDKPNGGHGSAINKGIEEARGKYFRVLDADDWYDTDNLDAFIGLLSGTDADMLLSPYTEVCTESGETVQKGIFHGIVKGRVYRFDETDLTKTADYIPMHTVTYKTSLLQEGDIRLQEHTFYVDCEYCLYPLPLVRTILFTDLDIYRYYIGRGGQSVSDAGRRKHIDSHLRVVRALIAFYAEHKKDLSRNKRRYFRHFIRLIVSDDFSSLIRCFPDRLEWVRQEIRATMRLARKEGVREVLPRKKKIPHLRLLLWAPWALRKRKKWPQNP